MTLFTFLNFTLSTGNLPPIAAVPGLALRGANLPPGTSVSLYSVEQALPRSPARPPLLLDAGVSLALLAGPVQSPFAPLDWSAPYPIARRDVSFAGTQLPLNVISAVPFFGSADPNPPRPLGRLLEAYFGFNPAYFPVSGTPFFGLSDPLPPRRPAPPHGMTVPGLMLSTPAATPFFGSASALPIRRATRTFEVYGRIGPPPFPPLAGDEFMISLTWAAWPQL